MPLPRRPTLALAPARPGWLTAGMLRLATLSLFVVAIGMIRWHLTTATAWIVVGAGAALALIGLAALLGATRRVEERLAIPWATQAFVLVLRRTGLPLLGLVFFLAWTVVYVALWVIHPEQAFTGLPGDPRFADFFYYAVCTALISPPGDIFAASRGTRSATMIEMLASFALLTAYLSSFVDWHRDELAADVELSVIKIYYATSTY
jgi:hypothetical protein